MLAIKQAVGNAVQAFTELFPNDASDIRLEEVMHSDNDEAWKIAISVPNPDFEKEVQVEKELSTDFSKAMGGRYVPTRRYKVIEVDAMNGELVSIRNA